MTVDPVDNCTFWYVNEYYPTPDKTTIWHTRVGSFSFPGCTPYISYNQLGPDRFNSPGYGFDVTLAHTDATQQVCLRWSTDAGTNWLATAACTYNSGSDTWACNMPANITDATITYQFWIGAAADSCAVTGDETLWTAYHSFNTGPTDVRLDSFSAVQPAAGWVYPLLAFTCCASAACCGSYAGLGPDSVWFMCVWIAGPSLSIHKNKILLQVVPLIGFLDRLSCLLKNHRYYSALGSNK